MSGHDILPGARAGAACPPALVLLEAGSTPAAGAGQPLSLSAWREAARARERRTEYLARACACHDMAVRTHDAQDAQFLRAMTIVWELLADGCAGVADGR